jgi:hypothetical protein
MKTVSKTTVLEQVKKFEVLWGESIDKRYEAARVYYNALSDKPDPAVVRMFHENSIYRDWTAHRWNWLYYIGSGRVYKKFLDVHNYALALCVRNIPMNKQMEICEKGLLLYSKEHKGGVVVPLRKLNSNHIKHVFNVETGKMYSVAAQRKKALYVTTNREPLVFARDTKGNVLIKALRKCTIDSGIMTKLLSYKSDLGNSILDPEQLRSIAAQLETA